MSKGDLFKNFVLEATAHFKLMYAKDAVNLLESVLGDQIKFPLNDQKINALRDPSRNMKDRPIYDQAILTFLERNPEFILSSVANRIDKPLEQVSSSVENPIVTEASITANLSPEPNRQVTGSQPETTPRGVWLMVHPSPVHKPSSKVADTYPEMEFRTALIFYHNHRVNGSDFDLYGRTTHFTGTVLKIDSFLYFNGVENETYPECCSIIAKYTPWNASNRNTNGNFHQGIILGAALAHGQDRADIFSHRVLFVKLPQKQQDDFDIFLKNVNNLDFRRNWCNYFDYKPEELLSSLTEKCKLSQFEVDFIVASLNKFRDIAESKDTGLGDYVRLILKG